MPKKQKAGRSKKAARKKAPPKTGKSQRERFIEAARVVGVDESGKEFDVALKKIIRPRE